MTVLVREDEGTPLVEITDRGVGMTPAERRRATEAYYRTDYARRQAIPGMGVGLTIAAALAAINGISLDIDENSAGGTTVILSLTRPSA